MKFMTKNLTAYKRTEQLIAFANAAKAANHPIRCAIIDTLLSQPEGLEVNAITDIVGKKFNVQQPTISAHLKVLAEADFVFCFPNGKYRIYCLVDVSVVTMNSIVAIWDQRTLPF